MASEYTPNYNLDLYVSTDKPNLRDQYNAAMGKIDTQMKKSADDVTNANANVLTMQTQMTEAQKDISALESTVETHGTQITGVQKTADDALSLAHTNEGDITALQTNMTQVNEQINGLGARIDTVEATADELMTRGTKILIIGDSYSDPTDNVRRGNWVKDLEKALSVTATNYSEGASGYVAVGKNGNTFGMLADKAITDIEDKQAYSHIIVYGGINDYTGNKNVGTVTANAAAMFAKLTNAFQSAELHVFVMNFPKKRIDVKARDYANAIIKGSMGDSGAVCTVHSGCENWLMCPMSYEDGVHPTASQGQKIIAQNILNGITGAPRADYTPKVTFKSAAPVKVLNNPGVEVVNGVLFIPTVQVEVDWNSSSNPATFASWNVSELYTNGHASLPVFTGKPTGAFAMVGYETGELKIWNATDTPDTGKVTYNVGPVSLRIGV